MTERRDKSKSCAPTGMPPLTPEAAAELQAQLDRVAAALEAGQDPTALRELLTAKPGDAAWDLHLIAALGARRHPAVPGLLAALFGHAPDKLRRKALKRAFHNLKTRGVPAPDDLLPREEATVGAPRPGAIAALISPVFRNGDSYVILEGPPEILGGNFLVSRINDRTGFQECLLLNLKRKQQEELWDHFRQQGLFQWFPAPGAYAVRLLEEAYRAAPQAETGAGRYASLRDQIRRHWGSPEDAPDLEEALPEPGPGEAGRLLEQAPQLVTATLFHSWLPSPDEILPWLDKIKEVQESPLVLSEVQRQVRLDAVVDEATRALYPPEQRPDWRRRLLAMAYGLDLLGRREEARIAAAAAAELAGERGLLTGENPFLKALVQFALRLAWEAREKPRDAGPTPGLVAPPTESLIIRG